jgi:hypothetical protein
VAAVEMKAFINEACILGGLATMPGDPVIQVRCGRERERESAHPRVVPPSYIPQLDHHSLQPHPVDMHMTSVVGVGGVGGVQHRVSAKFAFAEFRSIEEANNGMNLGGIIYKQYPLKVERPRAYTGAP